EGTVVGVFKGWLGLQIMDEQLYGARSANRAVAGPAQQAGGGMSASSPQLIGLTGLEPDSAQAHYRWWPRGDCKPRVTNSAWTIVTPEPAAAILVATALGGLRVCAWRRLRPGRGDS